MGPPSSPRPQPQAQAQDEPFRVLLFYKYVALADPQRVAEWQRALCESLGLAGRLRVAAEGVNGTLGGSRAAVDAYVAQTRAFEDASSGLRPFRDVDWKTSDSRVRPFPELLVRVTRELVALELPDEACDLANTGAHVAPAEFRELLLQSEAEDVAVVDVRNAYEFSLGHFQGAMNPRTRRFGQFPDWARAALPELKGKRKVLMYCTGGIRCEKASAFLRHLGVDDVYQLHGGIHRFLEQFPDGGGVFRGKNFVFDERVAVNGNTNADGIIPGGIHEPIPADADAIAGRCEQCEAPHDVLSGARCHYCRMHVLLCDACAAKLEPEDRFCDEHAPLVAGDSEELYQRAEQLRERLREIVGRGNKGKRRSLRKQLDTVERRMLRVVEAAA